MELSDWLALKNKIDNWTEDSIVFLDRINRYPADPNRIVLLLMANNRVTELALAKLMGEPEPAPINAGRSVELVTDPGAKPYDIALISEGHPRHGA